MSSKYIRTSTCALLAALVSALSAPVAARDLQRGAGADVMAAERALADALHRRDRDRMEQLLAPAYILRSDPDIDRATWIQNAITRCWGDRSDIAGFRATEHGNVVVASFVLTFYVDPETCRPAVLRSLVTDVWARQGDGWRLSIRHAGPAPAAGGPIAGQYGLVPQPPPIWDIGAEASLIATGGNTSTRTLGLAADLAHRSDGSTTRAEAAFLTSEAGDVTNARSLTGLARHGIRAAERVELFARAAYARNRFAGIENRTTLEAGVAYTPSLPLRHALTAEGGIGFTAEQRLDAIDLRFATATGAITYTLAVTPGTELKQDAMVAADLEAGRNWRGTSTTAITVTLTRLLSFRASHAFEYRNAPVPGFRRTDLRTAASLVFSVQHRPPVR